jgi:hypothetical protein
MPDINEDQRKRLEAVSELISTETRYQARLNTIKFKFMELSKLVIKDDDVQVIFQNLPDLVKVSTVLKSALERSDPDRIGSVLFTNVPNE